MCVPGQCGDGEKPGAVADRKLRDPGRLWGAGGALEGRAAECSRGAVPSSPPAGCESARPGGGTAGAEAELASAVRALFSGEASGESYVSPPAASWGSDAVRGTPRPPPCILPCGRQHVGPSLCRCVRKAMRIPFMVHCKGNGVDKQHNNQHSRACTCKLSEGQSRDVDARMCAVTRWQSYIDQQL